MLIPSLPAQSMLRLSQPDSRHVTLLSLLQFVRGDIQSIDLLSFVLASEKIDTVMHFAAQVSFEAV